VEEDARRNFCGEKSLGLQGLSRPPRASSFYALDNGK